MRSSVNIPRRLIVAVRGNAMNPARGKGMPEEQKVTCEPKWRIRFACSRASLTL